MTRTAAACAAIRSMSCIAAVNGYSFFRKSALNCGSIIPVHHARSTQSKCHSEHRDTGHGNGVNPRREESHHLSWRYAEPRFFAVLPCRSSVSIYAG
jgi:hypothetical protein